MLSRRALLGGMLGAWAGGGALANGASAPPLVAVQPYLPAPDAAEMDAVSRAITAFFKVDVMVLPATPLPDSAYTPPRKRHRAERLLVELEAVRPANATKIVGLTAGDISTTKGNVLDWGILGLGSIGGSACVLSSFRCHKGTRDPVRMRERLAKVVVHELGHTFGSEHCPLEGCLMEDAAGTVRTVDGERAFCEATRAFFLARGVPLVQDPKLPWR